MSVKMKKQGVGRFVEILTLCVGLMSAGQLFAESKATARSGEIGNASQTNCVVLERMGTVSQVTSRMLSFGVHGNEFQFVEGKLPEGVTFHSKLTQGDVRQLQASGADVVILDSGYLPTALMEAREGCLKAARKTSEHSQVAAVEISSWPAGSDIEIDGKFVGSTPSMVRIASGEHTVKLTKNGFAVWERTLTTSAGNVRISPDLQPLASAAEAATEETSANLDTVANNRQ